MGSMGVCASLLVSFIRFERGKTYLFSVQTVLYEFPSLRNSDRDMQCNVISVLQKYVRLNPN